MSHNDAANSPWTRECELAEAIERVKKAEVERDEARRDLQQAKDELYDVSACLCCDLGYEGVPCSCTDPHIGRVAQLKIQCDDLRVDLEAVKTERDEAHAEVKRLTGLLKRIPGVLMIDGRPELYAKKIGERR